MRFFHLVSFLSIIQRSTQRSGPVQPPPPRHLKRGSFRVAASFARGQTQDLYVQAPQPQPHTARVPQPTQTLVPHDCKVDNEDDGGGYDEDGGDVLRVSQKLVHKAGPGWTNLLCGRGDIVM